MKRFVYFAHCAVTGLIKIGITGDIKTRLKHVRRECGHYVRLLDHRAGTLKDEAKLKKQFAASHVGNEWFRVDGPMAEYLRTEIWGMKIPAHDERSNSLIAAQKRRYAKIAKNMHKAHRRTYAERDARLAAESTRLAAESNG